MSTFQYFSKSIDLGSTDRTIPWTWKQSHVEFVYTLPEPGPDQAYIDVVLVVRPRSRDCASFFFHIQLQAVPVSAEMKHLRCPHRCSRSHCVIGHRGTGRAVRVFVFDLGLRCDIENHSRTTLPWSLCQMDAGRGRVERGRHTGTS